MAASSHCSTRTRCPASTNALGRFQKARFKAGGLMGQIRFNETPNGTMAMGMVERGEIAGISAGYTVNESPPCTG
jgi:phage head maturation protease